jgi:predicted CoA-substrate-specific enzyme activase
MLPASYRLGIDIGSTTAKIVVLDPQGEQIYSAYRRHNTETLATLRTLLEESHLLVGEKPFHLFLTGSAGLGLCELFHLPFIQEVIASAEFVRCLYPQVNTLLDIGGEDAKLIFFSEAQPDIRMNGACAGGTGAFIDQMATLLDVQVSELDDLARRSATVHPIASRCGVFAKTDVQNLLSRDTPREEIAASIFNAVVYQTLAALARGRRIQPVVLFAGGPLAFLPALKQAFIHALDLPASGWLEVDHPELIPAKGAALAAGRAEGAAEFTFRQLFECLHRRAEDISGANRLPPLFVSPVDFERWGTERQRHKVASEDPQQVTGECFLGIDSGSTTTKLVLVDERGRLFFEHYQNNHGNPIQAAQDGLEKLRELFAGLPNPPRIARSAVTGYGEDLIRAAFGCDQGLVETLAHFRAARAFDPQVSFILDIGGQDMKAIFVRDGHIQRIEINEACSSGCGTFIETFARSLGYSVGDFAGAACTAEAPCDLGTRCTVFMNSRVKQALREGADVAEISAGLAYSVIKNALYKVLKITDPAVLGDHIVVQGGSFRNPAIHKALEQVLGKPVVCPDKAELMGALGAALEARDAYQRLQRGVGLGIHLGNLPAASQYHKQTLNCRGCENRCTVTKMTFASHNIFYTGNRCERTYSNRGQRAARSADLFALKRRLLFDRPTEPASTPRQVIGLPRALNFYENYPFWCTLLVQSGFQVRLSDPSSSALFESGAHTVMSENICFPAKLLHGHIFNLIEAGVDRIFYPMVFYEHCEFTDAINCYNCPIVSGYPDVVRSAIDPQREFGIPFDQPAVTFQDRGLLKQACARYLAGLGVSKATIETAFSRAVTAQDAFQDALRVRGAELIDRARRENRSVILLAGHPYHVDTLINHKIPEALADMGVDVLSVEALPLPVEGSLANPQVLTQWEYLNRLFYGARWVGQQANIDLVQLNSFGCGPDAFALDEVRGILSESGKIHTVLRIDEIDNLGSVRLRLRSLLETTRNQLDAGGSTAQRKPVVRQTTRLYRRADSRKVIIVPEFSRFCTPAIIRPVMDLGYNVETLPSPDRESVEVGLKYTNNEICYPGIVVIGDTIKALQSGRYDPAEVVVGSWETGGQCRASNISCLMKKALVSAGYTDIPVITISTRLKSFNPQPELKFNVLQYLIKAMLGMIFTDGISAMYHASVVRERYKGDSHTLAEKWMVPFENGSMPLTRRSVMDGLRQAVSDFNSLSIHRERLPKVGIVGEIYVKYNTFVNSNIVQWLIDQDLEVILPPLLTFFIGSFVGFKAGVQARIRRPDVLWGLSALGHKVVQSVINEAEVALDAFRNYPPHRQISEIAQTARAAIHLTHQYGEGWLLSGEVGEFVKSGVNNVLCLQPFGCIANHVIAKGVAHRLQGLYPNLNLMFLDLDAGASEVNQLNRTHFFVEQVRASLLCESAGFQMEPAVLLPGRLPG